jgi:hypothetical protein
MLDDTPPPTWIEVRNKSYLRGCVVLFVPGLGPDVFKIDPTRGSEGRRRRCLDEAEPAFLPHFSEIFKHLWLPKAPGTNTQLYSPVTGFLNCPLSVSQSQQRLREQSKRKGIS